MTEQKRIPIADPVAEYQELAAEIDAAVKRVLGSGRYILGPEGEALEREIAAYVGTEHAVGCNSGTDALHLALLAAGIRPGDEVVVPAFTFIATAEAVSYIGAKPVFTDVDPDTFCMDVKSLEACLSPRTRAVIPVHLYGQTAPIEQIAAICHERKLTLIEDCAQSLGADERGRKAGAWGDYGCFSFYPTKNLAAAGDAGLITTRDAKSAERLRMLRHHGSRQTYLHEILGYNSRLDEIQAAILRIKFRQLDRFNANRTASAARYRKALVGAKLALPAEHKRGKHVWHQFTVKVERRDEVRASMNAAGITTMVYYPAPLHHMPIYKEEYGKQRFPVSEELCGKVLSLPIYPHLDEAGTSRVAETLLQAVKSTS